MSKILKGKLIFDNAGGLIIQLPKFAHYYDADQMEQAAEDVKNYIGDGHTKGWEGNEPENAEIDTTYEEIANGGYREYTVSEIIDESKDEDTSGWHNIDEFCCCLKNKLEV